MSENRTQVVKNELNYSLYYNTLNYFRTIMSNHPSIEIVTQGDISEIDTNKFPVYPLGNVLIDTTSFGTNYTDYTIQLIVADKQKLQANESTGQTNEQVLDFYGDDDVVDIHANTLSIINDLTSYTARNVDGFEITTDISCEPFKERLDNGLAGWSSTFNLRVHNDRNRCLFFLINPSGSGFIIEDCETEQEYIATLNFSGSVGEIFSSRIFPNSRRDLTTYEGYKCYTIKDTFEERDDYDFVNLPLLSVPFDNYENCEECELWINPKIWGTTPASWGSAPYAEIRQWGFV